MTSGSNINTRESFLYGRFECLMKPAYGSGIVNSFFLFDDTIGFQKKWSEVDFEFLGRHTNSVDTNLIQTVNGITDKNVNVRHTVLNRRSSDAWWKLTLEWIPDKITWKVNDIVIRTSQIKLSQRMKLMMNIWQGGSNWAGDFDKGLLPQIASYEYVEYFEYSNKGFIHKWRDSFHSIDKNRWYLPTFILGETQLFESGASIDSNKLVLRLS